VDTHNTPPPPDTHHKPAITSQQSLSYNTNNGEGHVPEPQEEPETAQTCNSHQLQVLCTAV